MSRRDHSSYFSFCAGRWPRWLPVVVLLPALACVCCGPRDYSADENRNQDAGAGRDAGEVVACQTDVECEVLLGTPYCSPQGQCVACVENDPIRSCGQGLTCCGNQCVNTRYDAQHCGACNWACNLPNATAHCILGECKIESCQEGHEDCDMDPANGCEAATDEGGCNCVPGAAEPCYGGPSETMGVGICRAGLRTCNQAGTGFGPCVGEILPQPDSCLNTLDDDCDGLVNNGFESGGAGCICLPGDTQPCYTGPTGTENVGICHGGLQTCGQSGTNWGICEGQQTPMPEVCFSGFDEDCNGIVDDDPDADGDGWTVCGGDCCDSPGPNCANPELVNPGAFEVDGNGVDDDCDGIVDNPLPPCDSGLASNSSNPMHYAMAMGLCQTTTEASDRWGVISATFSLASGSGTPNSNARSIRPGFGATAVQEGARLAVLSSGHAAAQGDTSPAFAAFQGGQNLNLSSAVPSDWLAANGGVLPNAPGCPGPQGGTTANDPIMLTLRIRVPSNANSFNLGTNFFSSEYPEWVCSPYNDFFVVLLDSSFSGTPANPADKNLATYTAPNNTKYPVGVNLAFGNTGLFQQCLNGPTGCGSGSVAGTVNTCVGTTELVGTGFDIVNPPAQFAGDPGWCGTSNLAGGGTGWLQTSGNVVPWEIIVLRFAIWDTGDPWYDSVVLLDNFNWDVSFSEPGTGFEPGN